MKQYSIICIYVVLCLTFLIGCGEKEDKGILSARKAIGQGDYATAISSVQSTLSNDADNLEARYLKRLLQLRESTNTDNWHQAIAQIVSHLETLNTEIHSIQLLDDPDSDDLNRQDRLRRSRNSISGLIATTLAMASEKQPSLLANLASKSGAVVVTALLEARKCYQPAVHIVVDELFQKLHNTHEGNESDFTRLLIKSIQNGDSQIRSAAIQELGKLKNVDLISTYRSILNKTDEAPEVAYSVIVAIGALCKPDGVSGGITSNITRNIVKWQPHAELVSVLQLAARNNNAQVRMHAAKLLGRLQSEDSVDALIKLLADSNGYVKEAAIVALERIGASAIVPLLAVIETDGRNIIPDVDDSQMLLLSEQYQYIATAYIDDTWMKKYRLRAQAAAIDTLGRIRAEEAVIPLIQLLGSEDLKGAALTALISMRGTAVPALIDALQTGEYLVQLESAKALNSIGDRRAIQPFIDILTGMTNKEVKAIAAMALGNMRARGPDNTAVSALTDALNLDDTTVTRAAEALGKINVSSDETAQRLIAISMDKLRRETVRIAAINALWQLKPSNATQPMLLLLLSDETSAVIRANAVKVLSRIKNTETLPTLSWVLSMRYDEISDFQRHMKREYKTLDALRSQLDSLNIEWTGDYPQQAYRVWGELKPIPSLVRSEVARALGIFKGETVVEPLVNALADDQRATVRRSAAWALGRVGGDAAIAALITALKKDKQGVVRQEAAIALGTIKSEKSAEPLLDIIRTDKYETARLEAAKALREINPTVVDKGLVDIVKKGRGSFDDGHEVQSVQNEVIGALLTNGNETTTEFLLDALKTADDEWTRWTMVYMLGVIHSSSALDTMLAELESQHYVIRKEVVTRLGGFKDRKTVDTLIAVLQNREEMVSIRAAAVASLNALRDESAAPALRLALSDENSAIRLQAIAALSSIKDAKSVAKLSAMVTNPLETDAIRAAAVTALGNIGDKSSEDLLIRALDNRIGNIRNNAILALGKLESTTAVPLLISILEDKRIPLDASTAVLANTSSRMKAAIALGQIGGEAAINALSHRLIDDTEYIIALEDAGNRRNLALNDRKRNWSWRIIVNAAKKHNLPPLKVESGIAEKMQTRVDDTWEGTPIRNAASIILGRTRSLDVNELRESLADTNVDTRKDTARKIGETGTIALIPDLVLAANGENEDNKDVRRLATQALGELSDPSTTDDLIQIMNNDENHIEIRRDASRSLGKIGNEKAVNALIAKLTALHADQTERAFRLNIIQALGDAKSNSPVQLLETLLKDSDADIHFQAASALYEITGQGYGYDRL